MRSWQVEVTGRWRIGSSTGGHEWGSHRGVAVEVTTVELCGVPFGDYLVKSVGLGGLSVLRAKSAMLSISNGGQRRYSHPVFVQAAVGL